jgi:murein L,D-transpeptidase YcbB/YkuD
MDQLTHELRRLARLTLSTAFAFVAMCTQAAEPLLWLQDGEQTRQASAMLEVLHDAASCGLSPGDYVSELAPLQLQLAARGHADAALTAQFDQALTRSASRFVRHLKYGRVSARTAGFDLPDAKPGAELADAPARLAAATDVRAMIESFEPRPQPYRMLKQALANYRKLARDATLQPLPPIARRSIAVGDEYEGAPQLRRLLFSLADLQADAASKQLDSARIDPALADALRQFQDRHGLTADGVIGPQTFAALNVPLAQRVRQIELTMERWRWLAALPRPDLVVNIPQFMLYALPRPSRPGEQLLEMPVIVGRTHTRTPVFVAAIEQVVFQPYWDVPASIMRQELLPKMRADAGYLERHHFEIVRGGGDDARAVEPSAAAFEALEAGKLRLRQKPGPDNALGPVKFVLPNPYEVRLHGTPEQKLFAQSRRAFSHGCIRVSDPAALGEYVLANAPGDWNAAAVEAALCATKTQRVTLKDPVRIVIFYATAAVTVSRGVLFSADLYGHDARLQKLLSRPAAS